MAKILYGVAGEGFGHSSRSELIGQRLVEAGHQVVFAASRKSYNYLKPTFHRKVRPVYGLSFHYHDGKVHPLRTVLQNIHGLPDGMVINHRLFNKMAKNFKPDVVISDFEPFSAWWAWANRVPCVSVDHEHLLTCCELDKEPQFWRERFLANAVTRGYHTFADAYVILNFFQTPKKNKRATLTPPVIRNAVRQYSPETQEHIVIYSTDGGRNMQDKLLDMVRPFTQHRFFIYGFNEDRDMGNCVFKKTATQGFLTDLATCRGVIASAGFSLLSECLHFQKPMLLVPVQEQYEQILNAYYIEKLGLGHRTDKICRNSIARFLRNIDTLPGGNHPTVEYPDNERFFRLFNETFNRIGAPLNLCG
ncbi:MAG: MJ1255/VC2487 family glycosyltransferase [Planctomycetota bacterium]